MIKQLLLSGLLTCCIGLTACAPTVNKDVAQPKFTVPLKANGVSGVNYITDGYMFKDSVFFTEHIFDHNVHIDLDTVGVDSNYKVYATNISEYETNDYGIFERISTLTIDYDYADNEVIIEFAISRLDDVMHWYIFGGDDLTDLPSQCQYFAFYLISIGYLSNEQMTLFNTIFTKETTDKFVWYNGWYTYNNYINPNIIKYNYLGTILYNQNIYDMSSWLYSDITFEGLYSSDFDITAYTNNAWVDGASRNVYLTNCLLTTQAYNSMANSGRFAYVPPSNTYGLTDLFTDIADTPVRYIVGLFSFELFGVEFSVAFLGIITVICMVFIIKKVL